MTDQNENENTSASTEEKPWESLNSKMDQLLDMMTQEPEAPATETPVEIPIPPPPQELAEPEEESQPVAEKRNPLKRFLDWLM